ncbi:MAG: hypothetical protein GEU78_09530 [Actinobacteria bacterium]|nr:hypothetical protein [Actinomycetota bacterium]
MTGATQHVGKARVRRHRFPLTGEWLWQAARPGEWYFFAGGWHFDDWADAIAYATKPPTAALKENDHG